MQSIIDSITEWLKELLISGITSNLSGMFDTVNSKVGEIAGEVTVRDLLRPFEHNGSIGLIRCDAVQRGTHQSGEVGLDILVHRQSALEMGQGADYTMPCRFRDCRRYTRTSRA